MQIGTINIVVRYLNPIDSIPVIFIAHPNRDEVHFNICRELKVPPSVTVCTWAAEWHFGVHTRVTDGESLSL